MATQILQLQPILQRIYEDWFATFAILSLILSSSLMLRIYFRYKSNPHRPLITAVLDSFCDPLQFLRLGPWSRPCDMRTALASVVRSRKLASLQDLQIFTGDPAKDGSTSGNLAEFIERYQRNRQVTNSIFIHGSTVVML